MSLCQYQLGLVNVNHLDILMLLLSEKKIFLFTFYPFRQFQNFLKIFLRNSTPVKIKIKN